MMPGWLRHHGGVRVIPAHLRMARAPGGITQARSGGELDADFEVLASPLRRFRFEHSRAAISPNTT